MPYEVNTPTSEFIKFGYGVSGFGYRWKQIEIENKFPQIYIET